MSNYSEATIERFTESVISPLCLFNFYIRKDADDAFPDDSYPIRIPSESLSEGRYGMFTELMFKVLVPRGFDYWIEDIVKILNAFGTHVHHYEVCSPKYTSAERIEAQYIFKVHI